MEASRARKLSLFGTLLLATLMAVGLVVLVPQGQAQPPEPASCFAGEGIEFCLDKEANPNPATVGQPLTFTITGTITQCPSGIACGVVLEGITDTLPPGVTFVSATANNQAQCTHSGNTVQCAPVAAFEPEQGGIGNPFIAEIVVIPTQCGTFTNTVTETEPFLGLAAQATFTVQGCGEPPPPCPPVSQEFEQGDIRSGDVEPAVGISNAGDNANLSPAALQSANSGNVQNAQGVAQSCSETDDIEFEGSSINLSPSLESETNQAIEQAAAS